MDFSFVTDTSTLAIFDPQAMKHRLSDDGDWWSISEDALNELNSGNLGIVDLGQDGKYSVRAEAGSGISGHIDFIINVPSGRLFMGAGEEITGDGLEPEAVRGGAFVNIAPGIYSLSVARSTDRSLVVHFEAVEGAARNSFDRLPGV